MENLETANRLILKAKLSPWTGKLIQPAGAPDIGAVTFRDPHSGQLDLIVDSQQSVANHLESALLDDPIQGAVSPELAGLPFVRVYDASQELLTTSLQEAHRLSSPYILKAKLKNNEVEQTFEEWLQGSVGEINRPLDQKKLTDFLFQVDPNCLLHGIWLSATLGGRFKLPRALSGVIEAYDVHLVPVGGTKVDRVDPSTERESQKTAKEGYGNVPHHGERYAAKEIWAMFNLDLVQIRGYRLKPKAEDFLILLAFWKIRRFLEYGLRLRTSCDLRCDRVEVTYPENFELPTLDELNSQLQTSIRQLKTAELFADVTDVVFESK